MTASTEAESAPASSVSVPDFFIAGHSKCGTSALYLMLRPHPQIFMPDIKEPRFFAPELRSRFRGGDGGAQDIRPDTLDGYLALFAPAEKGQVLGEASPSYLRSRDAAGRIAAVAPGARIIAIFREPASFLRSFHLQSVHNHIETETDLRRALELEPERRAGRSIPPTSHVPATLFYSDHVRYVEQLGRFEAHFPPEQILVLIYDDFRADNEGTVRRVQRFLGVDDTVAIAPVATDTLPSVRSGRLHRVARGLQLAERNPAAASRPARALNALIPSAARGERASTLWQRTVYGGPPEPDQELMLELRRRFKPEVVALSEHMGRDLVGLWGYDRLD
jgi:Sulfotransferase family